MKFKLFSNEKPALVRFVFYLKIIDLKIVSLLLIVIQKIAY